MRTPIKYIILMKTIIRRFLNSSGFIILLVIPYSLIQDGTQQLVDSWYGHTWFRIHVWLGSSF